MRFPPSQPRRADHGENDAELVVAVAAITMGTATSAHAGDSRVRTDNPAVAAAIQEGIRRSATFRGLVEAIDASDGFVFVEQGRCGHSVRACLALSVKQAGPSRLLRVVVDVKKADWDLMGSMGHELHHAVEVLSEPSVNSTSAIYLFYRRAGEQCSGTRQEAGDGCVHRSRARGPQVSTRHVLATDSRVLTLIDAGISGSATFRGLVAILNKSDVIVYVEPNLTRQTLGGYLVHNIVAQGRFRYLRIAIEIAGSERRLVSLLAHELQHAVEVAQTPEARDPKSLEQLFKRLAIPFGCGSATCPKRRPRRTSSTASSANSPQRPIEAPGGQPWSDGSPHGCRVADSSSLADYSH